MDFATIRERHCAAAVSDGVVSAACIKAGGAPTSQQDFFVIFVHFAVVK